MRKYLSTSVIERYAALFGIKRKIYFKILKESDKHLLKRINYKIKKFEKHNNMNIIH